jgi:hypothetical protein
VKIDRRNDRGYITSDSDSEIYLPRKPAPRSDYDLSTDLPYPDAPMGNFGHQIGNLGGKLDKMITKGNKLFALGNTIASASNLTTRGDIGRKALEVLMESQLGAKGGGRRKSILDHLLGEGDGEYGTGYTGREKGIEGGDRKDQGGRDEGGERYRDKDRDREERCSLDGHDYGRKERRRKSEAE